ncbi:3-deoxy-D-arabinoheptulosonate-7-phosphate synthase [Nonomuraea sp. MG754425]|uniref:chorismate mutase n=1 Tax=Nonomuraea sp. MG754425 TaxID=2570319 RepID=UPI001F4094D6|nr:chorismate mutase [Nonomuraea sp. MG754425]MCF6475858.1 3-deoxy-D-arabinoheptulosonate-7-phosphate synthase [Nonomuraea sp. MG754425]
MSSTLERHVIAVGDLLVGAGPAVVIGGRVSLRTGPRALPREGATLVEPATAADLPAIAEQAEAVVVGASWTRDIPLVRAAAGLGLPVVVERRPAASMEEWLGLAAYCAAEGDGRVILCEAGGRPDLALVRAARAASGRPALVDVSADLGLSAAAVAAGADGLVIGAGPAVGSVPGSAAGRRVAEEAVTVVGALLRDERPDTLPGCRQAIDRVDAALATLLARRAELAGVVQRLKPVGGFAGRDLGRERDVVARMAVRAPALGESRLSAIMNAVIEAGLHLAEERSRR